MKKRNIGYIILFSAVLIACLWAFISAGVITETFKHKLAKDALGKKEVTIQNLLITETKEGKKDWELFAEEGYYDNADRVAVLNEIVGNFYKNEKVIASFESARGTYNQETRKIVLYERTIIVYRDGSNVSADKMEWSGKDSDVIASGNVRLELPSKAVVYAEKAVLNSEFNDLKVYGRTKTEIYDKEIKI